MKIIKGNIISDGIAIGVIRCYGERQLNIIKRQVEDREKEIQRFNEARIKAKEQLKDLYISAVNTIGKDMALIFEVQQLILLDEEYVNKIKKMIYAKGVNAEYAVDIITKEYEEILKNSKDSYISDRSIDICDVAERINRLLIEQNTINDKIDGCIVIADEIFPSDMVNVSKALGIITKKASYNSHSSIMSRNIGVPHVTDIDFAEDISGKLAIIDAKEGTVYIDPDEITLAKYNNIPPIEREIVKSTVSIANGSKIKVMANVNSTIEVEKALNNYCDGIGLFRTEFIYMNRKSLPTEDEQFEIYKNIASLCKEKEVIIRTLDAGADKVIDYLDFGYEKNPALGCRGIRYSLMNKEIFITQLRAIYRAAVYGNIKVMFPMIISVDEIKQIKNIISDLKTDLEKENVEYKDIELGIMVETPAAAMISDVLAKEVSFFSIGTNDLIQYSLALDRENEKMSVYNIPYHEGILRLIEFTIVNAHKENCKVGICGEMAADIELTRKFCELGIDSLSVPAIGIQDIKRYIENIPK